MPRHFVPFTTMTSLTLLGSAIAVAQEEPAPEPSAPVALAEIVVTAEKREASLQDTPISVVALDSERLDTLGIGDVSDLSTFVPNLQLTPHTNSASTPRIFIRGIGNYDDQITQDPSVAVYVDGVYIGRTQGMGTEAADLERIEVLRGPQGTLYGRNATGGAINFITRAPELGSWRFSQTLSYGRRDEFRSRTMFNAPLGEAAAVRFSYVNTSKDGFVDNLGTGEPTFGAEDRDALRADLLWRPDDRWELRYAFDRSTIEDTPFYLQFAPAGAPVSIPSASSPAVQDLRANDVVTRGHQLTLSWRATDLATVKLISAWRDLDSFVYQDYLSGVFGPTAALITENYVEQNQWSHELQLLGDTSNGRLSYIVGLYAFDESADGVTNNVLPATGVTATNAAAIRNKAYAAYAQGTYTPAALDERLHLTLGVRWSRDERDAELRNSTRLASGTVIPGDQGVGRRDFDDVSPTLTVAFDFTSDLNLYFKIADGYKTGGFNIRASSIERFEQGFGEETLRSYEIGVKSQWLNRRLRVNAAVFQADYDDIQLTAQSDISDPTRADILNAGEATVRGVELDATALLTDSLIVGLSYGYLDAGYDRIIDGRGIDVTNQFAFVNAPRHSLLADATWTVPLGSLGDLSFNASYSWQDRKYSTASTANGIYEIGPYGLLNGRITLTADRVADGLLRVSLWGRNLTDKEYSFIYGPLFGGFRAWGEPRSYGIELTYEH